MASVTVSSNPSTTGNTLTVNFTTDATNITDVQITKDGSNYSSATTFTNSSATFDVSSWGNGTYSNCYLKVIYTASGGSSTEEVSNSFGALLKSSSTWYVIGDSISDTGLLPQRKYMTVLGEAFPNVTITNVGKDGSHFTNKTTGYSTFASLLDKLPSTAPNVVTVFGGVNDFIQSCSIGTISSTDTTNFYGAVKSFVSSIKTKYSSSKIIFILPLNMRAGAFSTNSDGTNSLGNTLQDYRDVINSVCVDNDIAVIDLHSDSELQPDLISSDGLHPNQDGHALLASKLRASIVDTNTGANLYYNIEYTLENATSSNNKTTVAEGSTYSTTITTNSGYEFDTVHVVMNGKVIDDIAITSKTSTTVNITISGVTSDVYITVVTTATSSGSTDNYINATVDQFRPEGNCDGIAIDTGGNLTASTIGQWGMVRLGVPLRKLRFTVRTSQADYGALCWYIYNNNGDGTYNMLALGNIVGGENGKRFLMTIPGTGATQIDKLDISTINAGETLTIEMSGSTQTIKREDGSTLVTLTGNMYGWCGQSTNSSPFCSNVKYTTGSSGSESGGSSDPNAVYDNPSYSVKDYKMILTQDGYSESFDASNFVYNAKFSNSKLLTIDGKEYAFPLLDTDNGSRFRVDGKYPDVGAYRAPNNENGDPYVLLSDAFIPTVNNFNFSVGVRNGDLSNNCQLDSTLLSDCLYTLNCALPVINYSVNPNSNNTIILDTYNETWYGLTMTLTDHFGIRINKDTIRTDYGDYGVSSDVNEAWKGILVHELGHTLGFDDNAMHHPTLYTYRRNRAKVNYLQAPDIYTLKELYKETYNIDITKTQQEITLDATRLGLIPSADKPSNEILSIQFDYAVYTEEELYNKSDLIVEANLEFSRVEKINVGTEDNPLNLEYNIYKIVANKVIKGEVVNHEIKICTHERLNIDVNNDYKLHLKQFNDMPYSPINIQQGIQIIEP